MKLNDIIKIIEASYPLYIQEPYDNSGLIIGDKEANINGILIALDLNNDVIKEAIKNNCNLIITHHPFIFNNIKKLEAGDELFDKLNLIFKNEINVYSSHTPMDKSFNGINIALAERLNLKNIQILYPENNLLCKLVTFCPLNYADKVRESLFNAGAGVIGNYDCCSYNVQGLGSFRAGDDTNPFVGKKGEIHYEPETRIETIFPKWLTNDIISALLYSHPYEEVAYDIYQLENTHPKVGLGAVGNLNNEMEVYDFLTFVKDIFKLPTLRYSYVENIKKIHKVALCSGSGADILPIAINQKADAYLTADIKYHDFQKAHNKILLLDIGHYESEIIFVEKMYDYLSKKIPNFAIQKSENSYSFINFF
ncbi:MAG: Nif3-like dinuclear metal center hexameric protein [Bacteroidales bacterium]|jgi:dinuclear metal center YbgI/SA1388 family protein|nr:Nif3-like dinuclear metal center hexameric protein [Bacteroidales bacterium]MDI9575768.1 Nif3-like dinuclear metal center hexameric protein [Bacteroidota bacterium]MDD3756293.1 Nif3-like dinuclear metal center hexameric protein [Bacteroidales bacterium]HHW58876.1 Nif3-like dinuclear metal center hexameric protein [Bacteroidales bacterium]HOB78121.1 Nif3-like dinuclear metal center hexameric protein [Bacteroidales bacterium]